MRTHPRRSAKFSGAGSGRPTEGSTIGGRPTDSGAASGRPPSARSEDLADVLPHVQLVREFAQLWTQRIACRHHADQNTAFDHRHVAESALVHDVKRVVE